MFVDLYRSGETGGGKLLDSYEAFPLCVILVGANRPALLGRKYRKYTLKCSMLCAQRVRPSWLLLLLPTFSSSSSPK